MADLFVCPSKKKKKKQITYFVTDTLIYIYIVPNLHEENDVRSF